MIQMLAAVFYKHVLVSAAQPRSQNVVLWQQHLSDSMAISASYVFRASDLRRKVFYGDDGPLLLNWVFVCCCLFMNRKIERLGLDGAQLCQLAFLWRYRCLLCVNHERSKAT